MMRNRNGCKKGTEASVMHWIKNEDGRDQRGGGDVRTSVKKNGTVSVQKGINRVVEQSEIPSFFGVKVPKAEIHFCFDFDPQIFLG